MLESPAGSDFHESACSTVHESLIPRKCDLSRNAPGKRPLRKTHRERSAGNDIELRQHVYGEPFRSGKKGDVSVYEKVVGLQWN